MIYVTSFELTGKRVTLFKNERCQGFRIKCFGYASPMIQSDWINWDMSKYSYTLFEGNLKDCMYRYTYEIQYLLKLYGEPDVLQSSLDEKY